MFNEYCLVTEEKGMPILVQHTIMLGKTSNSLKLW
jgi:hypothetical protein